MDKERDDATCIHSRMWSHSATLYAEIGHCASYSEISPCLRVSKYSESPCFQYFFFLDTVINNPLSNKQKKTWGRSHRPSQIFHLHCSDSLLRIRFEGNSRSRHPGHYPPPDTAFKWNQWAQCNENGTILNPWLQFPSLRTLKAGWRPFFWVSDSNLDSEANLNSSPMKPLTLSRMPRGAQ